MPIYEYYCRTCNEKFSQLRPIAAAADQSSQCAVGHRAMKVLTTAAVLSGAPAGAGEGAEMEAPSGGGCACGRGSCGCGSLN